jgi:hypothetical protein
MVLSRKHMHSIPLGVITSSIAVLNSVITPGIENWLGVDKDDDYLAARLEAVVLQEV